jgi:hypothetical protein
MRPAPIDGQNRKAPPTAVLTSTEDLQESVRRIQSITRGDYREVYRITDTKTESRVLGTITLEPDLKIIKDQQASSINNVRSINFGVDKTSIPSAETEETEIRESPEPNQSKKRPAQPCFGDSSSSSSDSSEDIHQEHQRIIKESYQEPTIARALPTVDLHHLLQVHEYSHNIDEKIFGTPVQAGEHRLVFLYDIWSPGFRTIVKRTEFKVYESKNANPCIQRYTITDQQAAKYRVPPGFRYQISSVTIDGTGEQTLPILQVLPTEK